MVCRFIFSAVCTLCIAGNMTLLTKGNQNLYAMNRFSHGLGST